MHIHMHTNTYAYMFTFSNSDWKEEKSKQNFNYQSFVSIHNKSFLIPDSSVGKEFACNAGEPGFILGFGRSTGEGIGYPLQYSWTSPVAQLVKKMSAIRETWVRSLGWEDPLVKRKATHSSILAWRIPWTTVHGLQRLRHN